MRSPTVSPHGPDVAAEPVAQQWPIRAPNGLDMSAKAPIRQGNPPQVPLSRLPVLDSPHQRSPLVQAPGTAGQMALPHGGPNPATTPQPDRRDMADIPTERPNWPEGRVQASGRSAQIDPTLRPKDASAAIMAPALTRGTMRTGDAAAAPQQTAPTRPAAQIARGGTDGHAGPNANGNPPQTVMAPGQTLADPGTPPEPIVAHQSVEKPTRKTAGQPAATPLATDKAAPRPATAPFVDLTTPRPDLASFWQAPTANHGWQTALQFWTPPIPLAKPPARAAMPPSASAAMTTPEPVPMNLASTLNVAEPLHGDDRPRPVSAKKARESAPDSPALPTPLPIAAPAPAAMSSGPVFVPQTATSGDVDGAVAYAPLPATAAATAPTPMILTSHLPKGVPESLARAAKEERSELLLDPMELGKVRFELVTTGDKVQINLSVERPETLDLLRRNMDSLHREFREAGFDTSTLTFGQWGKGQEEGRQAPLTAQFGDDPDLPDTAPAPTSRTNRNTSSQGLDLRM